MTAIRTREVPARDDDRGVAAAPRETARRSRRPTAGRAINYLLAILVAILYLFPLLYLLNTALKDDAQFFANPNGLVTVPNWANFPDAWNQGNFGAYMINSVIYAGGAAVIGTVVSLLIGFPLARGYLKRPGVWNVMLVLILFLPNAIITQFQLLLRTGLYDTQIGYVLIMSVAVGIGPILLRGYAKSIPVEIDEAAALDGVGYLRYLTTFVIPMARPALVTVFILQAISVWNEIILATVLLPDPDKAPVTLGLYAFQGQYTSHWGLLAAATMIVAGPLVAAYVFLQRYLVSGVLGGAVKG
ncbi:carbohydrate ABC transporter permease [Leifsonia shinshuensis]|uniref:carbohydrate ABC transporter permease n=1 Tax=Leifsonia shinshuensis TaxID=150026 RepID=UPI001F508F42|nr:carbohydrate ABC transporter permease [Leifsonia shinshuensis]